MSRRANRTENRRLRPDWKDEYGMGVRECQPSPGQLLRHPSSARPGDRPERE